MIELSGIITYALVLTVGLVAGLILQYLRVNFVIRKFKETVLADQAKFRADLAAILRRQANEAMAVLDRSLQEAATEKRAELAGLRNGMASAMEEMLAKTDDSPLLAQEINGRYLPNLYRMIGQLDGIRDEIARTKERYDGLQAGLVQLSEGFWQLVQTVAQGGLNADEVAAINIKLEAAHQALGKDLAEGLHQMNALFGEMRRVAESTHNRIGDLGDQRPSAN